MTTWYDIADEFRVVEQSPDKTGDKEYRLARLVACGVDQNIADGVVSPQGKVSPATFARRVDNPTYKLDG